MSFCKKPVEQLNEAIYASKAIFIIKIVLFLRLSKYISNQIILYTCFQYYFFNGAFLGRD